MGWACLGMGMGCMGAASNAVCIGTSLQNKMRSRYWYLWRLPPHVILVSWG